MLISSLLIQIMNFIPFQYVYATENETEIILEKEPSIEEISKNQLDDLGNNKTIVKRTAQNYNMTTFENDIQINDGNGWKPINSELVTNEEGEYSTEETELDINFSKKIDSQDSFVEVTNNSKHKVEYSLTGIKTKNDFISLKPSTAEVSENKITYPEILSGVDLRHIVLNNEVKEDIILNKKIEDLESIHYELKTDLTATINEMGALILEDDKGKKIYEMPAPHMSDSTIKSKSGYSEHNYDIKYELIKKTGYYELKLVPTSNWLNEKRTYPVYIDPTLVKNATLDTFITSAAPDKGHNQFWNSTLGEYVLRVGKYDSSTGTNYAFVKMSALDSLKGAIVSSASLKTYVNWSYYATSKSEIWVDKVNATWSENNVTWNTRPTSTGITSTTVARNNWANFNVTNAVKEIATGKRTDYGFKFHSNGNETTHWKQLSAGENGKNVTNLSVNYTYPQMKALTAEPFPTSAGASTGYINLNWPSMYGAIAYRLQMFDGKGWQTLYDGSSTSFTTKGKKLWPLTTQYNTRDSGSGGIKFRNGDGQELPLDPSKMYSASSGVTSSSKAFQFRVIADYKLGSSTPSALSKPVLDGVIPDTPSAPKVANTYINGESNLGHFDIEWDEVEGATSYDLQIFNGAKYERLPIGNMTNWSSKNKKLFPLSQHINQLVIGQENVYRLSGDGSEFNGDPRVIYSRTGSNYSNTTNYFVKVIAKSSKGESAPSAFTRVWLPAPNLTASYKGIQESSDSAYINAEWEKINDASGYIVTIFNGENHQIVAKVGKDTTFWTTKGKNLWPLESQGHVLRTQGDGRELLTDPNETYKKIDLSNEDTFYRVEIRAYRNEDTTKNMYDINRYLGLSEELGETIKISTVSAPLPQSISTVNSSYPEMRAPKITAYSNQDREETGYFNASWDSVDNALGYKVYLFNGYDYDTWTLPADQTSWTTVEEGIFPTESQMIQGAFRYNKNLSGTELNSSPEILYHAAYEKNLSIDYTSVGEYFVRISAILANGDTPLSGATAFVIPEPEPVVDIVESINSSGTRRVELSWERDEDAYSNLYIFDGAIFKKYSLGEASYWDSNKAKVWPASSKGTLTEEGKGEELPMNPDTLYFSNGEIATPEENSEYTFIVETVSPDGESKRVEIMTMSNFVNSSKIDSEFDGIAL